MPITKLRTIKTTAAVIKGRGFWFSLTLCTACDRTTVNTSPTAAEHGYYSGNLPHRLEYRPPGQMASRHNRPVLRR